MRALGRLLLLPLQVVATLVVYVCGGAWLFLHRPAGHLLRGDHRAFTRDFAYYERGPHWGKWLPVDVGGDRDDGSGDREYRFDGRLFLHATDWIWRVRFVAPKGPAVF